MDWQKLIIDSFGRIVKVLERALDGLTEDDLNKQPHPDCNSMGWLSWHLTRWQDRSIAELMGEEQLWVKDKWHAKFNRAPDSTDTGLGHNSEDLMAFKSPDVRILLEYHHAVLERSRRYISNLSANDLGRELSNPRSPTVGARLVGIISDNLQHAGQVAYVRGLLKGKGWRDA
jgi:hypothetical protein